jgi:hypothetical protein
MPLAQEVSCETRSGAVQPGLFCDLGGPRAGPAAGQAKLLAPRPLRAADPARRRHWPESMARQGAAGGGWLTFT